MCKSAYGTRFFFFFFLLVLAARSKKKRAAAHPQQKSTHKKKKNTLTVCICVHMATEVTFRQLHAVSSLPASQLRAIVHRVWGLGLGARTQNLRFRVQVFSV